MVRHRFRSGLIVLVFSLLGVALPLAWQSPAIADSCSGLGSISEGEAEVGAKCSQPAERHNSGSSSGKDVVDYFNLCDAGPKGCSFIDCPPGQVPIARLNKPDGVHYTGGRLYCAAPSPSDVAGRALVEFRRYKPQVPPVHTDPANWALANYPSVFSVPITATDIHLTMLGHPLLLHITPQNYHWDFGDGTSLDTTTPGHPYNRQLTDRVNQIEHQYPMRCIRFSGQLVY